MDHLGAMPLVHTFEVWAKNYGNLNGELLKDNAMGKQWLGSGVWDRLGSNKHNFSNTCFNEASEGSIDT
jgi:hypothetical protein